MPHLFIRNFSEDIRRKAKAEAALEGVTLREFVEKALEFYFKKKPKTQTDEKGR